MSLNPTTIGSDNGLSPVRCQAILWTHADSLSLSNEPLATNLSEISMKMNMFAFKKMYFKMPCAKWWPFYHSSPCVEYTMIQSWALLPWRIFSNIYLVLTLITVFVLYNITVRQGPQVAELVNQVTWYFLYVWLPLQHPSDKPQCQ